MKTPGMGTQIAAAFFAIGVFAPLVWMAMDRDPPYVRESGTVDPVNESGERILGGNIVQGGDIIVDWKIRVRKACPPSTKYNVFRMIVDAKGKQHRYDPISSLYGQHTPSEIKRSLPLPDEIAVGPAQYRVSACFACNPTHYLAPVCVDEPRLEFKVNPR